jgi:hypothetical protein
MIHERDFFRFIQIAVLVFLALVFIAMAAFFWSGAHADENVILRNTRTGNTVYLQPPPSNSVTHRRLHGCSVRRGCTGNRGDDVKR